MVEVFIPKKRYAGPADRKAAEGLSKYLITDMYAKAVQGVPAQGRSEMGRCGVQEHPRRLRQIVTAFEGTV